jgi:hypothetical protein
MSMSSFIEFSNQFADMNISCKISMEYSVNLFKTSIRFHAMPRKITRDGDGRIVSFEYRPRLIGRLFGRRKVRYEVDYEQNRIQFHDVEQQRSWDFDLNEVVFQGYTDSTGAFLSHVDVVKTMKYTGIKVVRGSGPYLFNADWKYAPRTTPKNRAMTREFVRTSYESVEVLLRISWYGRKFSADISIPGIPYPAFGHKYRSSGGAIQVPRYPFPNPGHQLSAAPIAQINRLSRKELFQMRNTHVDGIRNPSPAFGRSLMTTLGTPELPFPFEPQTDQTYEGIDHEINANIRHIMWRHPFIASQVFSNFTVGGGSVFEVVIEAEHLNCGCMFSCSTCTWDYFTEQIPAKFQMSLATDDIRKNEEDALSLSGVFDDGIIQNKSWVILIYKIQLEDDTWMRLRIPHTISEGREIHDLLKEYPVEMFEFPQWGVNQTEWRTFIHGSDHVCGHCQRLLEQHGDEGRTGPKFTGDHCPHCKTEFVGFRPNYV